MWLLQSLRKLPTPLLRGPQTPTSARPRGPSMDRPNPLSVVTPPLISTPLLPRKHVCPELQDLIIVGGGVLPA